MVDAGGGRGYLLRTILEANPAVRGVLFDMAAVLKGVAETFAADGLADRARIVAGSFFDSVPADGDLYIFKRIFIDKTDDEAAAV